MPFSINFWHTRSTILITQILIEFMTQLNVYISIYMLYTDSWPVSSTYRQFGIYTYAYLLFIIYFLLIRSST